MKYNTKRKKELLSLFALNEERTFSADEILSLLPEMSQSTLYRLLSTLYEEGYLRKVDSGSRAVSYQYRDVSKCSDHMHIRCKSCGHIEHIDQGVSDQIRTLISARVGFEALSTTVLDGICDSCKEQ